MSRVRGPVTAAAFLLLLACREATPPRATLSVAATLADADTAGYARATAPRAFRFPADHGPHPEFKHEWWYFTGNVDADDGRAFGFQLTFFRSALRPRGPTVESDWATSQAYMAHFALTDVAADRFRAFQRFDRGALGLAGATSDPLRVWVDGWAAAGAAASASNPASIGAFHVVARDSGVAIDLVLTPAAPVVPQGDRGLSRKGPGRGNASYYYSIPRLAARGTVVSGSDTARVRGTAWLDREWGTSALASELDGWDWVALQLDDGSDLMLYRLRRKDGGTDRFSAGSYVTADGAVTRLTAGAFTLEATGEWTSPAGVRYPSGWRVRVPGEGLDLQVAPRIRDQELELAFRYWEGAVAVEGRRGGVMVRGRGYVELTGYAP